MPTALNRRIADQDLSSYLTSRDAQNAFTFCGDLPYSKTNQYIGFNYIVERNQIVRDIALRMNIRPVDLFAELDTEKLDDFRQDFSDMIHLRASAHPKIARAVYDGIKDLLRPASPFPSTSTLIQPRAFVTMRVSNSGNGSMIEARRHQHQIRARLL
jgi:hypothetical protein